MKSVLANWKTTIAGLALFALAGLEMIGVRVPGVGDNPTTLITAGLGLLFAKDANGTRGAVAR